MCHEIELYIYIYMKIYIYIYIGFHLYNRDVIDQEREEIIERAAAVVRSHKLRDDLSCQNALTSESGL